MQNDRERDYLETHDWDGELPRRCTKCGKTETEALDAPCYESRAGNIKDAMTLVRHIADYANGITEERLTGLWSEHSDAEVDEVVDKLAFVTDWLGLS
jgi:hypothetical protein